MTFLNSIYTQELPEENTRGGTEKKPKRKSIMQRASSRNHLEQVEIPMFKSLNEDLIHRISEEDEETEHMALSPDTVRIKHEL
jgi:hypothetical protein